MYECHFMKKLHHLCISIDRWLGHNFLCDEDTNYELPLYTKHATLKPTQKNYTLHQVVCQEMLMSK
jgi:hypothetical protein